MLSRTFVAAIALAAFLVPASIARADVGPPPDECSSGKKKEGEACKDFSGAAGACGTITYTRTFNPPFPDATPSVSQQSYFGCKTGATPTSTGSSGKKCSVSVVGGASSSWPVAIGVVLAIGAAARRRRR